MAQRPTITPGKAGVSAPAAPKPAVSAKPIAAMSVPTVSAPAPENKSRPAAQPPAEDSKLSSKHIGAAAGIIAAAIIAVGVLMYYTQVKPAQDFNPQMVVVPSFERNAFEDTVPEVPYEQYVDEAARSRYYTAGDGLELTFITKNDPRKGYADTEVKCALEKATEVNFNRPAREAEVNGLPDRIKKCVDAFRAPIPRTIPVNFLVDVTEGTEPIKSTAMRVARDIERKVKSPHHTFILLVSKIFDGPYTVAERWEIKPGATSEEISTILKEATDWALEPQGETRNSSISFGLLNGLMLRRDGDLRGGIVFIASDGFEFSKNQGDSEALDFYKASKDKSYLAESNWQKYDKKILVDNGGNCYPLHGARVDWYPPPSMDLTVRRTAEYWGNFLVKSCGAGSFVPHY